MKKAVSWGWRDHSSRGTGGNGAEGLEREKRGRGLLPCWRANTEISCSFLVSLLLNFLNTFLFFRKNIKTFYLFILACRVFVAVCGPLSCGEEGLLSGWGAWPPGMWSSVVAAPRGGWDLTSRARDWAHVPCIARQVLNHWPPDKSLNLLTTLERALERC